MNFLKAFFHWKFLLSLLLGIGLLVGLWFYAFDWLKDFTHHGVDVKVPDLTDMSVPEATRLLEEKGLSYSIDSIKFSEAHPSNSVLEFYPKAGSKVKPGRRVFIKSNPTTWAPVELPNLIDKSKRIAFTQLGMKGFVVGDTIYVKDPAKDAVLGVKYQGEEIEAGKLLPKGSVVDLILGRGYNFDMPVPNVIGMRLDSAKTVIEKQFFVEGNLHILGDYSDSLSLRVIYQDPSAKDTYDEGLPISMWLSAQPTSDFQNVIDSLDVVYRRKLSEDDSIFTQSIQQSQKININNLPEDIRNQVRYDANTNKDMKPENKPKRRSSAPAVVDTSGISID